MKNSRTSLNKPFYDWIKEVREADKKIKELEDKLYYYNVKLIGYNSPNFEPRLSSTKAEYKDNKYIWLEKIISTDKKIKCLKKLLKEYSILKKTLNNLEIEILDYYLFDIKTVLKISKSYMYNILNNIAKKFLNFNFPT